MGVRSLRSSIAVSVSVHFFFLMVCAYLATQRPAIPTRRTTWVELDPLKFPPAVKDLTKSKHDDEAFKRRQLVQTEKGREVEKAAPDALLGERNQTVDRQTVSRARQTVMGQAQQVQQNSKKAAKSGGAVAKAESAMPAKPSWPPTSTACPAS